MTDFDASQDLTLGTAGDAIAWLEASSLPEDERRLLARFVERFPDLTFSRETDETFDRTAAAEQVTLPDWFRAVRTTLAFVHPPVRVRFDDFDSLNPRSDDVEDIWYDLRPGYGDSEQRQLFRDEAGCYPIGRWFGTDQSYLAVNLEDAGDRRIHEFAAGDLRDNLYDGKPARASVYVAFDSYASMLAHIIETEPPDGTA
jgi:hypothetical protein